MIFEFRKNFKFMSSLVYELLFSDTFTLERNPQNMLENCLEQEEKLFSSMYQTRREISF